MERTFIPYTPTVSRSKPVWPMIHFEPFVSTIYCVKTSLRNATGRCQEKFSSMFAGFFTLLSSVSAGSLRYAAEQQKSKKNEQTSTFCRGYLVIFLPVFAVHPYDPQYCQPSSLFLPSFNSASQAPSRIKYDIVKIDHFRFKTSK